MATVTVNGTALELLSLKVYIFPESIFHLVRPRETTRRRDRKRKMKGDHEIGKSTMNRFPIEEPLEYELASRRLRKIRRHAAGNRNSRYNDIRVRVAGGAHALRRRRRFRFTFAMTSRLCTSNNTWPADRPPAVSILTTVRKRSFVRSPAK